MAPKFAEYLFEFPFGDIYSRLGLDVRSREIATIAALTAMGNAVPQLKVHIAAGLNVGLSRGEIIEIIIQMSGVRGIPSSPKRIVCRKRSIFGLNPRRHDPAWGVDGTVRLGRGRHCQVGAWSLRIAR